MDIDEETHLKIRKARLKWKCGLKPLRHFLIARSKLNFLECYGHFTPQTNLLKLMSWRLAADPIENFTDTVHLQ
jgi:hypothetical protein